MPFRDRIAFTILYCIGIAVVIYTGQNLWKDLSYYHNSGAVKATIIGQYPNVNQNCINENTVLRSQTDVESCDKVSFSDSQGVSQIYYTNIAFYGPQDIGKQINIRYNKNNHNEAQASSEYFNSVELDLFLFSFFFLAMLAITATQFSKTKKTESTPVTHYENAPLPNFFDPLGRTKEDVATDILNARLKITQDTDKYKIYQEIAHRPSTTALILLTPFILIMGLLINNLYKVILSPSAIWLDNKWNNPALIILDIGIAYYIFSNYKTAVTNFQERIILQQIALTHNWLYSIKTYFTLKDTSGQQQTTTILKKIIGIENGGVFNGEIWGKSDITNIGFWVSILRYDILATRGAYYRTKRRLFFIFPLTNSFVNGSFDLEDRKFTRDINPWHFINDINPTFLQPEFSKNFKVSVGDTSNTETVLDTNLQIIINDLRLCYPKLHIVFDTKSIAFEIGAPIFKHTNFFKEVTVNPQDGTEFQKLLCKLVQVVEMVNKK